MVMSAWANLSEILCSGSNWIVAPPPETVEPFVMIDNQQPHQELVKCVVVGDTAVGKTRLICARACNKRVSLSQLLTTHVPTVWAIDQYRMCKDVLERSWEIVDGVNVSLRLWDTFGDHEKDRRFAYGRSDVVLLCFSLSSRVSLRNCKVTWFPEIRKFCPHTPILLVGCKNDLRYMYRDETYLSFFRDRSPFIRPVRKSDLVMPDEARTLAREYGVYYYETSVLTYYGVNEVFENAIRAALISRKHQRFWMTNLKKVQRPLLQLPYCPPKPIPPPVLIQSSTYEENMLWIWQKKAHTDVIFIVGNKAFTAHKFILAAASTAFFNLFSSEDDLTNFEIGRSSSESSLGLRKEERKAPREPALDNIFQKTDEKSQNSLTVPQLSTFGEATLAEFNEDTEYLIKSENFSRPFEQVRRRSTYHLSTRFQNKDNRKKLMKREFNHPAFLNIRRECYGTEDGCDEEECSHSIITLSNLITPAAMAECLRFLYTGTLDTDFNEFQELRRAAEFMELNDLLIYLKNIRTKDEYLNIELKQRFKVKFRDRLGKICLEQGAFTDVIFQVDDGIFAAHRAILSARCDVMRAMFSGNFKERSAKIIFFPGVYSDTFYQLLTFLYTDDIKPITFTQCLDLIELANRLCLTRLINLVEKAVIDEFSKFTANDSSDVIQPCLRLLETCKLHNANQLADWCMIHLCVNYNKLCKLSPNLLKNLHPENQDYLMEHRWPPVWYLKDSDYYSRRHNERQKEDKLIFKRSSSNSRCSCFGGDSYEKASPEHHQASITVTWKIR